MEAQSGSRKLLSELCKLLNETVDAERLRKRKKQQRRRRRLKYQCRAKRAAALAEDEADRAQVSRQDTYFQVRP